jgi:hypothetical protein
VPKRNRRSESSVSVLAVSEARSRNRMREEDRGNDSEDLQTTARVAQNDNSEHSGTSVTTASERAVEMKLKTSSGYLRRRVTTTRFDVMLNYL